MRSATHELWKVATQLVHQVQKADRNGQATARAARFAHRTTDLESTVANQADPRIFADAYRAMHFEYRHLVTTLDRSPYVRHDPWVARQWALVQDAVMRLEPIARAFYQDARSPNRFARHEPPPFAEPPVGYGYYEEAPPRGYVVEAPVYVPPPPPPPVHRPRPAYRIRVQGSWSF